MNVQYYHQFMNTIKVPLRSINVGDVVIITDNVCIVTNISNARASKPLDDTQYHIIGRSIIDSVIHEDLQLGKHIFNKLVPQKCNMKVIAIDEDLCSLSYCGDDIKNVILPRTRNNIINRFDKGESVELKVDNYLDKHYVIRNNPRE